MENIQEKIPIYLLISIRILEKLKKNCKAKIKKNNFENEKQICGII